jgi:hypothetical protein
MQTRYQADFGPFDGKVWLNCAHQGALPRAAADEAREAITWKVRPFELTAERFAEVPARLRRALGRLLVPQRSKCYGFRLWFLGCAPRRRVERAAGLMYSAGRPRCRRWRDSRAARLRRW